MKNYYLYHDHVDIVKNNGSIFTIYFNQNSGKVYFRYKIGAWSHIKHAGIFLGFDSNGIGYFLHNHYHYGKAHITTESGFRQGKPIYIYEEKCSNAPLKVIEIGLNEILRGERFKPLSYNCQTYTSTACHNQRRSEDADRLVGNIVFGTLALVFIGVALNNNK